MKKLNLKNKLFITTICLSLAMGLFPATALYGLTEVFAYTPSASIITNGEFDTTSSSYPASSSNWSVANGATTNSSLKSGIISTTADELTENQEDYGLSQLPNSNTTTNNSVYMLNIGTSNIKTGIASTSFTLDANSHYLISVDVATSLPVFDGTVSTAVESHASIYLVGNNINSQFTGINTNKNWKTYTFFVTTNSFATTSATIELWLGTKGVQNSSGAVLFDNVQAIKYDNQQFNKLLNSTNYTSDTYKVINDSISNKEVNLIANADFDDELNGWTKSNNPDAPMSNVYSGITTLTDDFDEIAVGGNLINPGTNLNFDNENALYINNLEEAGVAYTSDEFTIARQTSYKLSVYAKTQNIDNNGASISLIPTNDSLTTTSFNNITTSTTTNSITNNWTKYTFYIMGSPFQDEKVSLQLSLGSLTDADSMVKGAVFFDDIEMFALNYKQFTSASEDTNNKKANLFTQPSSPKINNAFFNFADSNYEGTYPLKPADWTSTTTTNSGIISTNSTHFNAHQDAYGDLSLGDIGFTPLQYDIDNPDADNNLLMIRNDNSEFTTYTSTSVSMDNNTYYKLTIDAKALTAGQAYIKILSDSTTLSEISIDANTEWTTYEYYINNVFGSRNIQVVLGLGTPTQNASGYAFFDNIILNTTTEVLFNAVEQSETINTIDFASQTFNSLSNTTDGIYVQPYNWSISTTTDALIDAGVLVGQNNKLVINSISEDTNIQFNSKITYTLDSDKFYKLTFNTSGTGFEGLEDSGIILGLKDTSYKFEGITSTEDSEYIMYIKGGTQSSAIPYFGLVTNDSQGNVVAYLNSIKLETISELDFTKIQEDIKEDEENAPENILLIGENTITEEETNEEAPANTTRAPFDWILVPSLIIGLALIVAIVGVFIRRAQNNKKPSSPKKKATYDRTRTLHPEVLKRQAEEARRIKLEAIEERLRRNQEELDAYEQEYKLKRERALATKQEKKAQAEFKAYAKGRSKLAKKQEQLLEQKDKINSDDFLQETEEQILKEYETQVIDTETTTQSSEGVEPTTTNVAEEQTPLNDEVEIIEPKEPNTPKEN